MYFLQINKKKTANKNKNKKDQKKKIKLRNNKMNRTLKMTDIPPSTVSNRKELMDSLKSFECDGTFRQRKCF
jgi:hypothetical protein